MIASSLASLTSRSTHRLVCLSRQITSLSSRRASTSTKSAASTEIIHPTQRQLWIVALTSAIPMIGFGFMDNIVMIQAGDLIDQSIGVTFGLSTLTAAGFGQCISDVAGFTSGGIVDALVSKLNMPRHGLSQAQLGLKQARIYHTAGGCVGVVMGCLLGMCSLFFMDTDKAERMRKAKELKSIFQTVVKDAEVLVQCERATLWLHDEEKKELWSQAATGTKEGEILRIPHDTGICGAAVQEGVTINVHDAHQDDRFNPNVDKQTGYRTRSVIAVPVKNDSGKVIGCIQMVNKKNEDYTDGVFDENDAKLLIMLSNHVKSFNKIVTGDD